LQTLNRFLSFGLIFCDFNGKSAIFAGETGFFARLNHEDMRLTFSLVFTFIAISLFGQQFNSRFTPRERGWVTFGIDGGWAYQTSDVRTTFNGWGAGLTLGKNVAYRPGGLLSFDIRSRLLFTRSYGADWRTSANLQDNKALNGSSNIGINYLLDKTNPLDSSFVFANHRTGMGELDLEGVITFNRLRERTGIVLNLFGGIGFNVYRARIDQGTADGNAYNYLSINQSNGKANILAQLDNLRDGKYESRADGSTGTGLRAGFMPDAGVELGYQLGRHFVMGVGHKVTFSRTDVLDGQRFNDQGIAPNDWAHYTNIFMRWDLGRDRSRTRRPEVDITSPNDNPYISNSASVFVKANIRHVNSPADVHYYVNGEQRGFEFRNGRFGGTARLRPGRNEITVEASNPAGSDEETLIVIWEDRSNPAFPPPPPPPPAAPAPQVRITNPSVSPFKSDRNDIYFRADVQYVRDKRDIRLTVNGAEEDRFTLAEGLEANLRLRDGRNIIRVEATTPAGRAADEVVIEVTPTPRTPPTPPTTPPSSGRKPNVNFTQPTNTASTADKTYDVKANVANVARKEDITLLVNNREISTFNYNSRSGEVSAKIDLQPNDNEVVLKARNSAGEAQDQVTITRRGGITPPTTPRKPTVSITEPGNNATFDRRDVVFKATTANVTNRSEIVVVFNGATFNSFEFDGRSLVSGNLNLKDGDNTLTVKVTNSAGSNEATVRFKYAVAVAKPVVDIITPANGSEVRTAETPLRATVKNVGSKNEIQVYANGKAVTNFEFNNRTGQVSATVGLDKGENTLRVTATNSGGSDEAVVRLKYTEAVAKPIVRIEAPADGATLRTADTELRATVLNVSNKNDILVYLNGRTVASFTFDANNGKLTAPVKLGEGDNTIRISASNAGGSADASHKVKFSPQKTPTVVINTPADRSRTDNPSTILKATTTNVFSVRNVVVKQNGTTLSSVNMDRSGVVTMPLTLREGNNTIAVEVSTPDGSDKAEVTVVYAPPAPDKPTITFIQPGAKIRGGITKSEYEVKAKVTGVEGSANIKVFANNTSVRLFTYNAKTQEVSYKVTLKEGKNTFKITAENKSGSTQAEADITYTPKATGAVPEVKINSTSQPSTNPFNPNTAKTSVTATLKNVTERSQITITVNGTPLTDFEFTTATGALKCVANLVKGNNTIVIKAVTPAGEASDSKTVVF
jgi:large repetitive protein